MRTRAAFSISRSEAARALVAAITVVSCRAGTGSPPASSSAVPSAAPLVSLPNPSPAADGSPRFVRFIGASCALSIDEAVWCRSTDDAPFVRSAYPKGIIATVDHGGIRYLLSSSGQVFRAGSFVPDSPEGKKLDYARPQAVDGLADVAEMAQNGDHVFVRRRSGAVESWWNTVVRDDDGLAIRPDTTPRKAASPEKFQRMFIGEGACFDTGTRIRCLSTGAEAHDQSFELPLPFPSSEVASVRVHGYLCVLKTTGETLCMKDPLHGDPSAGLPASSEFMASARAISQPFASIADRTWGFVAVDREHETWLFNPELRNDDLKKLAAFGKVRDFSQFPCVVSLDGRIRCHDAAVPLSQPATGGRDVMIDAKFER